MKKKKPIEPPLRGKLSPQEVKAIHTAAPEIGEVLYFCRGDMREDLTFCEVWFCFTKDALLIAEGEEKVSPSKKRRHLENEVRIDSVRTIPLSEIDSLVCERYVATGRAIAKTEKGERVLLPFSIGHTKEFDRFTGVFNKYKETGELILPTEDEEEGKCKKCGAPCPPDKEFCKKHDKSGAVAIRLFSFFGGYIPQILIILLLMAGNALMSVWLPQLSTRTLFDNVLSKMGKTPAQQILIDLGWLVLSVIGIRLLNTAFSSVRQIIQGSLMPSVIYDIKVRIFQAMQRLSVNFYSSKQTGSLMDRVMRDANNIYWFFVDGVPGILIESATLIGVMVMMFIMNPKLSLIALVASPPIFLFLFFGDKFFRTLHHRTWSFSARVSSLVSDNVAGQRDIKAFAKENDEYRRFGKISGEYQKAELKLALTEATVFPIFETAIMLLSTLILGVGGRMVAKGELSTGTLLSFIVYLEMLQDPFDFLSWVSNWWSRCADSAQRVFEIVDAKADVTEADDPIELTSIRGDIEIRDLFFEYEPARPIIKKFNLKVDAGHMLGIVGKTGAGKTTLASLIARLYDPKEGSIFIDGVDIKKLSFDSLHKSLGVVSQDIYLFMGSVADNIRYAKPDASMEEVIAAAKAADAHDFIMKLPDAYETRVGAGGQKLSVGERQRVSIARTIIQNPKILILDEATAAMDTATERNIQASLSKLKTGRTTLAIAHRLSTLRDADTLAVIDDGTLTEYGTFDELMEKQGEFYKLYKIQEDALRSAGILEDPDAEGHHDEEEDE